MKFLLIEENPEISKLITICDELYKIDNDAFIRVSYSINRKLIVEFKDERECVLWYAFNNFKQNLNVKNTFKMFEIPKNENEALNKGYKLLKSTDYQQVYLFKDQETDVMLSFQRSGEIIINHINKNFSRNRKLIFILLKHTSDFEKSKISELNEIINLKEKAQRGINNLEKADKKYIYDYKKYEFIVIKKIKEILNFDSNYYLGNVDFGIALFDYKNNFKKSEKYLMNAIKIKNNRGEAYGYLLYIYFVSSLTNRYNDLKIKIKKNLSEYEQFRSDQILFLLLKNQGMKKNAQIIFEEMKSKYTSKDLKNKIKKLQKMIKL